ncbi:MAG TPA: SpoIIE family protein phosphatase [Acidobacteriaceae bacterium]|nr:SpoIIE family protein phosphatase [Acidobacteriaceae bacterium]
MRRKPHPNLLRTLLGVFILAGLSFWLAGILDNWEMERHAERHVAAPLEYNDDTCVVTAVQPEARRAGLVPGMRITGLNGAPYTGDAQLVEILYTAQPGDTVDVEFTRPDGSKGTATITLALHAKLHAGIAEWVSLLRDGIVVALMPLVCLLIGYWVVLAKPADRNAWLLLILLTFPSVLWINQGMATGVGLALRLFWYNTLQLLASPALLLFGIYFPERSRIDVKAPWIKWLVLAPYAMFAGLMYPYLYREYFAGPAGLKWAVAITDAGNVLNVLNLICIALYLVFTLDKLRSASTADARRRLRVLTVGTAIGVGALLLVFVLLPHFGFRRDSVRGFWITLGGGLAFMVAPFTLAYVVLVQRAMDVRMILRMGTRYLLAKAFLLVAQIALIGAAVWLLLIPALHRQQPGASDVAEVLLFLALVVALRVGVQRHAQMWLDRKFFREAYNAEVVLNELADEVRQFTETGPLLETVVRRVAETLHVDQIAVLLRRREVFHLEQALGVPTDGTLALPAQASAVRYLATTNEPARLYRDDPDAWYLMAGLGERQVLDKVNAELLLPLRGRHRLMGVMALGPKRSQAAYTPADLHMLQTLATQTGLAIEVAELAHSLAAEAAQRERVNREIEIAREVQERLFPQEMPQIEGATIAGHCRPALGVGGDYYDVFLLDDGRIGLAIGDVSGKGIAAALLMASLRASLRGVSLDTPRDFAKLMDKVNRLVYEASASNRYATFFFAAYDAKTRRLDCVNAGHNPPVVLRCGANGATETLRLEEGGPVVGLLPFAPYTEESVTLMPGDLLLLFTDGISEAMTYEDEEWGEERMIESAKLCKDKTAETVLKDMFRDVDAFTAGAPQHDDMTMLVLKLEE